MKHCQSAYIQEFEKSHTWTAMIVAVGEIEGSLQNNQS